MIISACLLLVIVVKSSFNQLVKLESASELGSKDIEVRNSSPRITRRDSNPGHSLIYQVR